MLKHLGKRGLHLIVLLGQSALSLILVFFFSKWFLKRFTRNESLDCIILGNGPSLDSQLDEVRLMRRDKALLCVNDFPLSLLFDELKPEYYTFVDPYYWFLIDGRIPARTENLLNVIGHKVKWPIQIILPCEMKDIILSNSGIHGNKLISVSYFNSVPIAGFSFIRYKMYDWYLGLPVPQNVLVAAIYLMLVASYKKIFIFGADHSWHEDILVTKENVLCVKEPHFKYQIDEKSISEREEFYDPIYKFSFGEDGKQEIFKVHDLFAAWSRTFDSYWTLKEYANYLNSKVINLSKKSYIDAFDRII